MSNNSDKNERETEIERKRWPRDPWATGHMGLRNIRKKKKAWAISYHYISRSNKNCFYHPLKRSIAFYLNINLNPFHPSMFCAKFHTVILGKNNFKSLQCIFVISLLSALIAKGMILHLNKKTSISFTQECFYPSLVEIGQANPKKTFKCCQFILLFCYNLPLEKGMAWFWRR